MHSIQLPKEAARICQTKQGFLHLLCSSLHASFKSIQFVLSEGDVH